MILTSCWFFLSDAAYGNRIIDSSLVNVEMDDDIASNPPLKKFRKGDLIKVNRAKYQNSLESKSSDKALPEYIFVGPGELLLIKGDYCQVRWRRPVPDVWLRLDQLESWK